MVLFCFVLFCFVWFGLVWFVMVWFGLVWFGVVRVVEDVVVIKSVFFNIHGYAEIGCLLTFSLV